MTHRCRAFQSLASLLFILIALLTLCLTVEPESLLAQTAMKGSRKVLVRVDPDYPAFLRNGHFEGRVVVEATVLPNGNVTKVEIKGGNPIFSEYASKAVLKWKYAPGPAQTVEEVNFIFTETPR
jgi:TonB family protein